MASKGMLLPMASGLTKLGLLVKFPGKEFLSTFNRVEVEATTEASFNQDQAEDHFCSEKHTKFCAFPFVSLQYINVEIEGKENSWAFRRT